MAESSAPQGGDMEGLAKRVDDLNRRMDDANAAVAKAKMVSISMTLVIVVAAIVGVIILLMPLNEARNNRDQYVEAFQNTLQNRVVPELRAQFEGGDMAETAKKVGNLVTERIKERQDEVSEVVYQQSQLFVEEMRTWGEETLIERRNIIRDHIETKLRNEVPVLQDPENQEVILVNGQEAIDAAVKRMIEEYLGTHVELFFRIENQLNNYPVPPEIAQMSDNELMDELTNTLGVYAMDIMRVSLDPNTKSFLQEAVSER